ncbi:TonB-dependent receptor [Edaphobacter acidisoli]|uniref:TonB-dependent receptor n=1 Tax=Edaphobacter acidisoli TaxID=2040573 RepID=UPI001665BCCE|nr:TonB-dependent receptor [Edaphobacter acidisoli]
MADTTGAVVPGAQVVATDVATGVKSNTVTTGAGVYTFPSLPPGTYNVTATAKGFTPATITGVPLHVAQLLTVNLKLPVGGGTETVTVSSDAQLLETSTAQISHYISAKEMTTWPILVDHDGERQLQAFIFNSLPGTTGNTFTGSIEGGQYFSNEIYLDGVSMGTFDTAETPTSVDAVTDFNMQIGAMGAQYNGGGTAVSNYGIKSGTNHLHGSIYEFFQNEALDANTFAAKQTGTPRAKQRLNNFGGTVGGPIFIPKIYDGRNKSFFFVSDEKTKITNYTISSTPTTMPTQAMLGGDFSGFLNPALTLNSQSGQQATVDALGRPVIYGQIYDPTSTRLLTAGQVDPVTGQVALSTGLVRDPFPGNKIPTNRFDPVAANYLKLKFPTNYLNSNVVGNIPAFAAGQPTFSQNILTIKLDQTLTQAQRVEFMYSTVGRNRSNSGSGTWAIPGTSPLDTWHFQDNPGKVIRANDYWEITSHIMNHFGIGYNRFTNIYTTPFSSQNWGTTLGLKNIAPVAFPTITFGGGQKALGDNNDTFGDGSNGSGNITSSIIGIDQVFISHGAHQLQAGVEYRLYRENDLNISTPASFAFSNVETDDGQSTSKYAGNAVASFMLGQVDSTGSTVNHGNYEFNRHEIGTYIQDDWKVSPKLSLNLGLRWEIMGGITEAHGQMTTMNPLLPNSAAGNLPGALQFASQLNKKGFERTDWGLILPRFGITYAATPQLVLRAGFGVNTQSPEAGPAFQFNGPPSSLGYTGRIVVNHTTNPTPYRDMAIATLSNPYPSFSGALPNYDPTQANTQSPPAYIRPDGSRVTYVENYNLGLQYAVGNKTIAELNYVGNRGRRIYAYGLDQLNQLPVANLAKYGDALLDPLSQHPEVPMPYVGFDPSNTVQQALAPFPQYQGGGITQYDYNIGWSRYDSLQATITRKVSKGFNVLVAYTWSKTLTDTNSNCNSGQCSLVQDVHNLKAEKAIAEGIDVPQQLKFTAFYDLPFGKGRQFNLHGPLNWIAGGWTLSGNAIYQSGSTLAIVDSFPSNGIFATTRPNFTGAKVELNHSGPINISQPSGPAYLNSAAFAHVPTSANNVVALTTGNVPSVLNNVVGPGQASENASLQKSFDFGEERSFQLRADGINLFNRAGRANPVTDINDPNFGLVLGSAYAPRIVQLNARFSF